MKALFIKGVVFATSLMASAASADARRNLEIHPNLTYTQAATENGPIALKLDFAAPRGACVSPRPTMVMLHGGGFKTGSRKSRNWKNFAVKFAKEGWNSASISYRLVKDEPVINPIFMQAIPDDLVGEQRDQAIAGAGAVETTIEAVGFLANQGSHACIDPNNIFLIRSSAGGVAALNTTFLPDEFGLPKPNVAGVVNFWGALSNINAMGRNDTPVFIIHGTADRTVKFESSESLFARGQETGTPVQLHAYQGRDHGWKRFNAYEDTINGRSAVEVMIDWIDTVASGRRPTTLRTNNR